MRKLVIFLVLMALLFLGVIASSGSASAKTSSWKSGDVINTYAEMGSDDVIDIDTLSETTFQESNRVLRGMDIYRTKANTKHEYRTLRNLAKSWGKRHVGAVLFCKTSKNQAKVMGLRYNFEELKRPSKKIQSKWNRFAKQYKKSHTCSVY